MVKIAATRDAERWCCFITAACADSRSTLLTRHIRALGAAVREVQRTFRVRVEAFVVLPDHLHAICSLQSPAEAAAFCRATMAVFARRVACASPDADRGVRRLQWDCTDHPPQQLRHLIDCIHLDAVRHGLTTRAAFWPWSSFSHYVRSGIYPVHWNGAAGERADPDASLHPSRTAAITSPLVAAQRPMCDDIHKGSGGSGCASARRGLNVLSVNSALVLLCGVFCFAFAHSETAADSARTIEVVAIAADVHSIVVRDGSGQLARYSEGAAIAGTGWRVLHVSGDVVTFASAQRLRGSVVEMPVHAGDRVDLAAQTAHILEAQQPRAAPAQTNVRATRRNAAPSH